MTDPSNRWQPLSGGTAVWVFMTVEVVTFGLFLLGHAHGWRVEPEALVELQEHLSVSSGTVNTVLLLAGSGCAYLGILCWRRGLRGWTAGLLWLAATLGVAFAVHKVSEWLPHLAAGHGLSSGRGWFSYLFLTQLHFLHVLPGIVLLGWGGAMALRRPERPGLTETLDTIAAYWHLVDVVWILLFTVLYLMHP